jgi:hypothetical protein
MSIFNPERYGGAPVSPTVERPPIPEPLPGQEQDPAAAESDMSDRPELPQATRRMPADVCRDDEHRADGESTGKMPRRPDDSAGNRS